MRIRDLTLGLFHWVKIISISGVLFTGLVMQSAMASTTTLTFDDIPEGVLSNQYSPQGILFSFGDVISAPDPLFPYNSGPNIAYGPLGLIRISISLADVKTVSAFVTGPAGVGIYAYDANGNRVDQSVTPTNIINMQLSVTSSGAAIAHVDIHNGGATFAIDDLTFTTGPTVSSVPPCLAATQSTYQLIKDLPLTDYVRSKTAKLDRTRLLAEVAPFEKMLVKGSASQETLQFELDVIKKDVKFSIKVPRRDPILDKIELIKNLIRINACQ